MNKEIDTTSGKMIVNYEIVKPKKRRKKKATYILTYSSDKDIRK